MRMPHPSRRPSSTPAAAGKITAKVAKKPRPPHGGGRPWRPGAVLVPAVSYPVYDRVVGDAPRMEDDRDLPDHGDDLTWSPPEALAGPARASRPGLFVIERLTGRRWAPVYVGMSAVGVGEALRWVAQAPAVLGLDIDLDAFRVRIAEAGFGTADPAGRAALRRLRDQTAAAIESREGHQVLVAPGSGTASRAATRSARTSSVSRAAR